MERVKENERERMNGKKNEEMRWWEGRVHVKMGDRGGTERQRKKIRENT